MNALEISGLTKSFGPVEIIRGVDLAVRQGERHALIGPNGAGKSTLFHLISGRITPTRGEVRLNGRPIQGNPPHRIARLGLARSFQITNVFGAMTVEENLRTGVLWRLGYRYTLWHRVARLPDVTAAVEELMHQIGLSGRAGVRADMLAYPEQRALELGLAIAGGAAVLLLDEPMAGMSRAETAQALALIRRVSEGRTLLMVEHDMGVVFDLADRISVLVYGQVIATGTPDEIRANPAVREAYLGSYAEEGSAA